MESPSENGEAQLDAPAGELAEEPVGPEEASTPTGYVLLGRLSARSGTAGRRVSAWLSTSRLGLVVMALVVGACAGLGAVAFRWLIYAFTWLATGHEQFGQQGYVGSLHLPFVGIGFLLVIPIIGGLIYGPLIQRYAREARGHGVPEVMVAVAENGGRIRPQVTAVKAVASALCIGVGGSVGREGPIVQISSALASTFGQVVKMSESRLRILVACGAAGGIAATFNAPITGLFFGFEIVLREFSLDALFATSLSAVTADLVGRAFFGSAPFFTGVPHGLAVGHDYTYLLVVLLGLLAGLLGVGFKTVLYGMEDLADRLWKGRPEWARPAVGGLALGAVLLALPEMYGVGYPVMDKAFAGHIVLWLLVILMLAKIVAASVTLSIGGSGGVFAPSLFTGAMAGTAFGLVAQHLFGPAVGSPAIYAVVAMGGVFAAAAQAPLTAIASVVEMTGNFGLTVAVMLAVGLAVGLSKRLSHGSIYTAKLLRRGIDIERPKAGNVLQLLTVADVMRPCSSRKGDGRATVGPFGPLHTGNNLPGRAFAGHVTDLGQPQILFADETLEQALRQLVLFGSAGLPVVSGDRRHLEGWVTRDDVLRALSERVSSVGREAVAGAIAAEFADGKATSQLREPSDPLDGYDLLEIALDSASASSDRRLADMVLPEGSFVVGVSDGHEVVAPRPETELRRGARVLVLAPITSSRPQGAAAAWMSASAATR